MALDSYSLTVVECLSELGSKVMQEYWPRIITRGSTDGSHSDMSGFQSLHSNDKAQRRNQNGAKEGEGPSSRGSTDGSHSDISGFHSLHSNDQPQKRTLGDTKSSQSNIMSKPGTLASTEDASYANDPKVTVTLDPPLREADTCKGGSQLNQNEVTEEEWSSSSGSTDGSHSDIFHSLLSNDKAHRRSSPDGSLRRDLLKPHHTLSIKDVMAFALTGRTLSIDSTHSDMSGCLSLHSNDEAEGRTESGLGPASNHIQRWTEWRWPQSGSSKKLMLHTYVEPPPEVEAASVHFQSTSPMAALRSENGTSSYSDISQPGTLASTESAPRDGASQTYQFLHVGRPLSEVGGSSEVSSWGSLRSTESPVRRRLHSTLEKAPEDITTNRRKRMYSV